MTSFTKVKSLSAWRKLSLAFWKAPQDPSVYAQFEINAENLLNFLKEQQTHIPKLTLTTLVAKALGLTLEKHPAVNAIIKWGQIYKRNTIDVFLQIAVEDDTTPHSHHLSGVKIANINQKSLKEIHEELKSTSQKIRKNNDEKFGSAFKIAQLLPTFLLKLFVRLSGFLTYNLGLNWPKLGLQRDPFGSAMLTNIGSMGIASGFAPLVPFSQTSLLMALGRVQKKAWVEDEKIVIKPVLEFSITFDHRLIDGWHAALMHKTLLGYLMHPEKMA